MNIWSVLKSIFQFIGITGYFLIKFVTSLWVIMNAETFLYYTQIVIFTHNGFTSSAIR